MYPVSCPNFRQEQPKYHASMNFSFDVRLEFPTVPDRNLNSRSRTKHFVKEHNVSGSLFRRCCNRRIPLLAASQQIGDIRTLFSFSASDFNRLDARKVSPAAHNSSTSSNSILAIKGPAIACWFSNSERTTFFELSTT